MRSNLTFWISESVNLDIREEWIVFNGERHARSEWLMLIGESDARAWLNNVKCRMGCKDMNIFNAGRRGCKGMNEQC